MAVITGIEWADITWNLWRGCTKVSRACIRCYAEAQAKRNPRVLGQWGKGAPRVLAKDNYQKLPFLWNQRVALGQFRECEKCGSRAFRKPIREGGLSGCPNEKCEGGPSKPARPRVFAFSFADWLDAEVPVAWLAMLIDTIRKTPEMDYLLLTKRPENWRPRMEAVRDFAASEKRWDLHNFVHLWLDGIYHDPPANIWVGATVESQETAIERLPHLLKIPAWIRFLSCEPLVGMIDFLKVSEAWSEAGMTAKTHPWANCPILHGIHWIIAGGESGPGSEPSHPVWYRTLLAQAIRYGVPFMFKQRGDWSWIEEKQDGSPQPALPDDWREQPERYRCLRPDGKLARGPDDRGAQFVVRVGKHNAGRILDGRQLDGYPAPPPPAREWFSKMAA